MGEPVKSGLNFYKNPEYYTKDLDIKDKEDYVREALNYYLKLFK